MNRKLTSKQAVADFLKGKMARPAKSKLYRRGQRVTPVDTPRKRNKEYLFVTSMRWEPFGKCASTYGGFILLNPRTKRLISCTAIAPL